MISKSSVAALVLGLLLVAGAAPHGATADSRELPADVVPNELVIGFEGKQLPADAETWVAEALGGEVLITNHAVGFLSVRFADADAAEAAMAEAMERGDVAYAERDGYVSLLLTPDDPMYRNQWGFPAIDAEAAWDVTMGSHSVNVAVLDTGLDVNHPDLAPNACGPYEDFTREGFYDGHGHGTHVSGTIAAVTNDAKGVAGTSQSCLMHGKVLNSWGSGQWSWIASGVTWAADNGAHIISMSLGGGGATQAVKDALNYAYVQKNVLIISAAGNSSCWSGNSVGQPASFPESMAVAASRNPGNAIASFSSCGEAVDIAAPGASVLSTLPRGRYASWSGTSMATPHVSGVAALVKTLHPELTAPALRCVLTMTADDMLEPGKDIYSGWGHLNALRAVTLDIAGATADPADLAAEPDAWATGANVDGIALRLQECVASLGEPSVPEVPADTT